MLWGSAPSLLTIKKTFCTCVVREVSLTSRMRNTWSLYLLSKQDSAPLCPCHYLYFGVSVHRGQIPATQPGAHLPPASGGPGLPQGSEEGSRGVCCYGEWRVVSCLAEVESRTEDSSFGSIVLSPPSAKVLLGCRQCSWPLSLPHISPEGLQLLILVSQGILSAGSKPCVFSGVVSK